MWAHALNGPAGARHVVEHTLDARPPVDDLAAACFQSVQHRPGRIGLSCIASGTVTEWSQKEGAKIVERQRGALSFEDWITYVFDHPVTDPAWLWDIGTDYWDELGQPATTVAYLTRAFDDAHTVLAPFSDAQLNQGLWFLASNSCSNHMFALLDPAVPWPARERGIRSMFHLFGQVFMTRCVAGHLSHLDRSGAAPTNPLNTVCYMWWDILPIFGRPAEPAHAGVPDACLEVMRLTLDLDSDACRESALHGLGHWHHAYPLRVETIVDAFLQRYEPRRKQKRSGQPCPSPTRALRPELRAYALSARTGCVL